MNGHIHSSSDSKHFVKKSPPAIFPTSPHPLTLLGKSKPWVPGDTAIKTEETHQSDCESDTDTEDILYSQNRFNKDLPFNGSTYQNKKKNQPSSSFNRAKGRNPLNSKCNITRCAICKATSMTHGCRMKLPIAKLTLITLLS